MTNLFGGCGVGAFGCLGLTVMFGLLSSLSGGTFRIDLGGVLLVMGVGGVLGLIVAASYQSGRDSVLSKKGRGQSAQRGGQRSPKKGLSPPLRPSGAAATVSDALLQLVHERLDAYYPELRYLDGGALEATFVPRNPGDPQRLVLRAEHDSDVVSTHYHGPRGEVVMRSGAWRDEHAPNAHLRQLHDFVDSFLSGRLLYVHDERDGHRFLTPEEAASVRKVTPTVLVRAWGAQSDTPSDV